LRTSVFELAERQGVEIDDVLVADASRRTTTLNAYVSGFGTTRRVVLYDNLVEELPQDEASVIVAHELAHAKHRDVMLGTTLGAVGALFGVTLLALALDSSRLRRRAGVTGPADPCAVPLVLALSAVAMLAVSPVENTISRAIEARADRESLAATGESATFVSMQRELALASLSDPTPPRWSHFWFGSHPTVLQRAGLPASLESVEGSR
jgi:STE24 endopeptidase